MAVQGKAIKLRIRSIKNTKKITKAMELIAASKMKKAVSKTLDARAYANYSWEILRSLQSNEISHPLYEERTGNRTLIVLITSNRAFCGAYNAQVIRSVLAYTKEHTEETIDFISVGKKGDIVLRRLGKNIIAHFDVGETISLDDVVPIGGLFMNLFEENKYDRVHIAYTDYVSALVQKPNIKQILPFSNESLEETMQEINATPGNKTHEYLFEPGYENILKVLISKISRMQVYHTLLESFASEQSARMLAMKSASDAAGEMIEDLTLVFNKARQASITQEISEISAGMASVS